MTTTIRHFDNQGRRTDPGFDLERSLQGRHWDNALSGPEVLYMEPEVREEQRASPEATITRLISFTIQIGREQVLTA